MPVVNPHVPPRCWRLSEEGRHQSITLAERLEGYGLEFIVTSEEPKAAETGEIASERLGIGWAVASGLHEHDRTGAAFGTKEEFESSARNFFENPERLVWGNETAEHAQARFASGVHAVLKEYPKENLAVVAHGTVNTLFLMQYNDIDAYGFWSRLGLPSFYALSLPDFELRDVTCDVSA